MGGMPRNALPRPPPARLSAPLPAPHLPVTCPSLPCPLTCRYVPLAGGEASPTLRNSATADAAPRRKKAAKAD